MYFLGPNYHIRGEEGRKSFHGSEIRHHYSWSQAFYRNFFFQSCAFEGFAFDVCEGIIDDGKTRPTAEETR